VLLVARVVDARHDLGDAVGVACQLADDQVVLVVAGEREHEVGRPRDPGRLQHVHLGRVAEQDLVLELVLEAVEARLALLDQRHLVLQPKQRACHVGSDLAAARDDHVHQTASARAREVTAFVSAAIAVCVGQTVYIPRSA
jgi:hypothetical protein